jgi:drug/metabolite transporter (DMT)-like permease
MNAGKILIPLSYAAVYIIWGSTYFFIRMADETIPVLHILAIRWAMAGIFFILLGVITGRVRSLNWKEILSSAFLGVFLILGGNGLVVLAEKNTDSYLAALVLSTSPLIVALFDRILWKKRLSTAGFIGIIIGITGVALLLYGGKGMGIHLTTGILIVFLAGLCWSLATSMGHRMKVPSNTFVNTGFQMLIPGLLAAMAILFIPAGSSRLSVAWSGRSVMALTYLTILGSVGFLAYTYLIKHEPAVRIMSYCFVNPLIAMIIGFWIGLEKPVPLIVPAVLLILTGLALQLFSGKKHDKGTLM